MLRTPAVRPSPPGRPRSGDRRWRGLSQAGPDPGSSAYPTLPARRGAAVPRAGRIGRSQAGRAARTQNPDLELHHLVMRPTAPFGRFGVTLCPLERLPELPEFLRPVQTLRGANGTIPWAAWTAPPPVLRRPGRSYTCPMNGAFHLFGPALQLRLSAFRCWLAGVTYRSPPPGSGHWSIAAATGPVGSRYPACTRWGPDGRTCRGCGTGSLRYQPRRRATRWNSTGPGGWPDSWLKGLSTSGSCSCMVQHRRSPWAGPMAANEERCQRREEERCASRGVALAALIQGELSVDICLQTRVCCKGRADRNCGDLNKLWWDRRFSTTDGGLIDRHRVYRGFRAGY